jgi:deoxycytidine triphosphate deaminase
MGTQNNPPEHLKRKKKKKKRRTTTMEGTRYWRGSIRPQSQSLIDAMERLNHANTSGWCMPRSTWARIIGVAGDIAC